MEKPELCQHQKAKNGLHVVVFVYSNHAQRATLTWQWCATHGMFTCTGDGWSGFTVRDFNMFVLLVVLTHWSGNTEEKADSGEEREICQLDEEAHLISPVTRRQLWATTNRTTRSCCNKQTRTNNYSVFVFCSNSETGRWDWGQDYKLGSQRQRKRR